MSDDFSQGKRGAVINADNNKTRITIRLDSDLVDHFKQLVHEAGGGNYQTLINNALREYVKNDQDELELRLRKIIREELKKAS
jgi:uncharacterized protein (DUF4415 family)